MKNIITALGNENVNNKLREYKEINVVMKDIQYKEGIIEILEKEQKIDYIIISELLPGQIEIIKLLKKIQEKNSNINLIIILDKPNEELENKINTNKKIKIYYNNQIKIKELASLIINKNNNEDLKKEIQKLKKIIQEKNIEIRKKTNQQEIEKEIENEYYEKNKIIKLLNMKKEQTKKNGKIIVVSGIGGVGKSIFTVNISKSLEKNKKRILIIDLDIFNNSIHTLFGVEKNSNKLEEELEEYKIEKKEKDIKKEIIKINKYINIISGTEIMLKNKTINENEFIKIIEEERKNYDAIIIDTATELNFKYTKEIMKKSDKIIFLSEANIMQIKKTYNMLDIYLKYWKIEKEKINIIFNKVKNDSIDEEILKEIFKDYKILGMVKDIQHCNTIVNNNMKSIFINKKIKKQYIKLQKKIFTNDNIKIFYLNKIK